MHHARPSPCGKARMRVHFFVRTLNDTIGGGSHYNSIAYIRALRKGGHSVEVHVLYPGWNSFPADISPIVHEGFDLGHLGERAYIAKLLRQYESEADIFFLYSAEFMWGASLYRRTGGATPVVVYIDACLASLRVMPSRTFAMWLYQYKRLPWDKTIGLRDARYVDRFLPCSPAVGEKYKEFGFPRDTFTVLPNIVSNSPIPHSKRDGKELTVLYVGRLVPIKGVDLVVEAMARLKEFKAKLVIVGDGESRADIEKLVAKHNMSVEMPGWVSQSDISRYCASADIFVHPTRCFDAAPRGVVEALQCGLPVIVPDTGGAAWIAGEAGLVYKTSDKNALTEALRQLLASPKLRQRLASKATAEAQRFDESAVYPQLEKILLTAIEGAKIKNV